MKLLCRNEASLGPFASIIFGSFLFLPSPLLAQSKPPASPPDTAKRELKIFQVKHQPAVHVAHLFEHLNPNSSLNIVPMEPRLIVQGNAGDLRKLDELIKLLDVPDVTTGEAPSQTPPIVVYRLKHIAADPTLEKSLQFLTKRSINPDLEGIALDRQQGRLVVVGNRELQDNVRFLLDKLDVPTGKPVHSEMRVRIVWLVAGGTPDVGTPPPDDLKDVVGELEKLGVEKPHLAAQTMISAVSGEPFKAEGVAKLGSKYYFEAKGMYTDHQGEQNVLQISLGADEVLTSGRASRCKLETEITAPFGHSVVLGMTPIESRTSIFVVQVLPPTVHKSGDRERRP
jgi:hypothetical protein